MGSRLRPRCMALIPLITGSLSCAGPIGPSDIGPVDQFIRTLESRGFTVKVEDAIAPNVNRFFSVPAQPIIVDGARVSAFEYPTVETAAAEAAMVSPDGQPNPLAMFTWVSTPRFYRQGRMIVTYVGCSPDLVSTLDEILSPAFMTGRTPCRD